MKPMYINGEWQECDPYQGSSDEICDGLDNDCNDEVDDLDADSDGYSACIDDCDDAASGSVVDVPGGCDRRANRKAQVGVACTIDDSEGARVDSSRIGLKIIDYLHGSDLRGAGYGPTGKGCPEDVRYWQVRLELAFHRGYHVVKRRIGVYLGEVPNPHRTHSADTSEIITLKIDDHRVLGAFLGVSQ